MSKRRKKRPSAQQQRQEQAELRKKFYRKVKQFFTVAEKEHLFKLIPIYYMNLLYQNRLMAPKVLSEEGVFISGENTKIMNETVYAILKDYYFDVPNDNIRMNMYDYLTIGLTVHYGFVIGEKDFFPGIQQIRDEIGPFMGKIYNEDFFENNLTKVLYLCTVYLSGLDQNHYPVRFEWSDHKHNGGKYYGVFRVGEIISPRISVNIDSLNRPVYQVGWVTRKFNPATIPTRELKLDLYGVQENTEIYIQKHALIRLKERLDMVNSGDIHLFVVDSCMNPVIREIGHNKYLIEYRMDNFKLGYLVADLIEAKLIIRTFLLVTQSGAPEEKRLSSITGLTKEDVDYLNLCKLSSFVNSDIHENSRLLSIFEEAGCEGIINFAQNIVHRAGKKVHRAEQILKYIEMEEPLPTFGARKVGESTHV
ncbi:hypothetical protein [Prolixibacter denitrificans]|uniref:Uncharacterized protein n=1 Tax=Prolixibacter denitrificans TaxID=1541063 RepID=A0A2P8CCQ6_9BACT|nr:hypothetical protein [Prolixibacter denitrificans]PSK82709.1 hypothetical protein CLV93_105101 [Prolixibacter denitrificans]GET21469.1 hypothetical protein JCM18694_17150 [Prolixibacter denitrificans]